MENNLKIYRRNCLLGALGALLMLAGDLCLSVVPASSGDKGLFVREAYLNGSFDTWRLPLLVATGLCGMALGFFTVRAFYMQIKPQYVKTRKVILIGGVIYISSAGALHLFIGSLADWTSRLAPIIGSEQALLLIQAQYDRVMPAMLISYAGMLLFMLCSAFALLTKKTFLPRWTILFHIIILELVFVAVPDIRHALGADVSTWDFVLSQSSGNAALFIWLSANAILPRKYIEKNGGGIV